MNDKPSKRLVIATSLSVLVFVVLASAWCLWSRDPETDEPTRPMNRVVDPEPQIMAMFDFQNRDFAAAKPDWGPAGAWMWWRWTHVHNDLDRIEAYLARAEELGKPVALSVLVYPALDQDATPPEVYATIGGTGWKLKPSGGVEITYPRWGDPAWEAEFASFVRRFADRFDGDPRVQSVWIATGIYGETVVTGYLSGIRYDVSGHNFAWWVRRVIDVYADAFVETPLYIIGTGATDRLPIAEYAAARGVGWKFNALAPDLPNDVGFKSVAGLTQVALAVDVPIAAEHYFADTVPQTYWSMLKAAWLGLSIVDLPDKHLDVLASIELADEGLWERSLRWMKGPLALYVARDTQYKCDPPDADWECGYEGAWTRNMAIASDGYAATERGSAAWNTTPLWAQEMFGAYGIGRLYEGELILTPTLSLAEPVALIRVIATNGVMIEAAGRAWVIDYAEDGWREIRILVDADQLESVRLSGSGYVHLIAVEPAIAANPTPTYTARPTWTATPTDTATPLPPATPTVDLRLDERLRTLEELARQIGEILGE